MTRTFLTRAVAGLALLAVVLGAAAFQTKSADAQVPVVSAGGPYAGTAGVPMRFTAATNIGAVTGVFWSFGDGSSDRGLTVVKTYAAPGVYPVSVTVTTAFGQNFTATTTATIGGAAISPLAPVVQNCQFAAQLAQIDPRGIDPDRPVVAPLATHTLVCNPTVFLPGTVVFGSACYNLWVQFGFAAAWAAGCR